MGQVPFFASSRWWDKWFTIPVARCRLLCGAVSTVPTTIRALQPEYNVRHIVERFRDPCRLVNWGKSALGTSVNCFATHFWFLCFCFKKPRRSVNTQNPTGQGTLDPSRASRVLPPNEKNGYLRDSWCWQATDKTLENSRLFGITPGRSLSLASNGGY